MCLLVFYINPNPKPDEFYMILVNVRDEVYDRPTKYAAFWDSHPHIIGGMDMEQGKEGGSWLAMNKSGKIAALLNILQPDKEILPNKKGRGFLAVDFVKTDDDPITYLSAVSSRRDDYNGFLLVALDLRLLQRPALAYFSNSMTYTPLILEPGIHAFGNSLAPDEPWPKVRKAKEKFSEIVSSHYLVSAQDDLVSELFKMLQDKTCHGADENMKTQGKGKSKQFLSKLSAIFVEVPESNYGSRCHTVILINNDGMVDYYEKNRVEGSTFSSRENWITNHFSFKLE